MDHIGIDVHKRESQIYILAEDGEVIEHRIRTEPERFAAVLGSRPRARVLIEASTDSEWVARCLEALGHEVIVADPNFAPMYATRSRKVKTDRRDARALAEAGASMSERALRWPWSSMLLLNTTCACPTLLASASSGGTRPASSGSP